MKKKTYQFFDKPIFYSIARHFYTQYRLRMDMFNYSDIRNIYFFPKILHEYDEMCIK